jgi:hypothetical protein
MKIEHSIGQAHALRGEWNQARIFYDRMMNSEPSRIKDSAFVLSDISEMLYQQGNYRLFLTIQKKYYSSNHPYV